MVNLSVNINKIATLRNSRGGQLPDLLKMAVDCQRFGAQGITVHPRPDERHIRYSDVLQLSPLVTAEFNIEGNPSEKKFINLVLQVKPTQVTLVPDTEGQLTSDHGWNTVKHKSYLTDLISVFRKNGIRTSVFVDPDPGMIEGAKMAAADRVELYTEAYARDFRINKENAIQSYVKAALVAADCGLGLNAGHDLNLENLNYFRSSVPGLLEVSIGHALIADALYFGIEKTIGLYLRQLA